MLHSRTLRWCLAASALLVVITLAGRWLFRAPSAFPPLPEPNGYVALTRAAAQLQRPPDKYRELRTEQLSEAVAQNAEALGELRRALSMPGAVTVQMTESWWLNVHAQEVGQFKQAASALDADAELRLRRGDTNGALGTALDGLRLSEAMQRGGLYIDFLVGVACEAIAVRRLTNVIQGLSVAECRRAMTAIQEHETRREPVEAIQVREKEWVRRSIGIHKRIGEMIGSRSLNPGSAFAANMVKTHQTRSQEVRRLLLLRLASRAHTLERGTPPRSVADLVPAYLPQVPVDPATGRPLELP